MKKSRYISFVLLMLFVVAFGGRMSAHFMCSCEKHHHEHEHVCCSCSHHISDCRHHDQTFKDKSCKFHFVEVVDLMQLPVETFKVSEANSSELLDSILSCVVLGYATPDKLAHESPHKTPYRFSSTEWSGVCGSLRAPPVLV